MHPRVSHRNGARRQRWRRARAADVSALDPDSWRWRGFTLGGSYLRLVALFALAMAGMGPGLHPRRFVASGLVVLLAASPGRRVSPRLAPWHSRACGARSPRRSRGGGEPLLARLGALYVAAVARHPVDPAMRSPGSKRCSGRWCWSGRSTPAPISQSDHRRAALARRSAEKTWAGLAAACWRQPWSAWSAPSARAGSCAAGGDRRRPRRGRAGGDLAESAFKRRFGVKTAAISFRPRRRARSGRRPAHRGRRRCGLMI